MDLEAPMDAWYVWVGVSLVSVGLAGIAVSLPSEPPPDAGRAATAVDRVAAAGYDAGTTLDHDADAVRIGTERIAMRSDGGTARARVSFGAMVPVDGLGLNETERDALDGVLAGVRPLDDDLAAALADVAPPVDGTGEWRPADGRLRARAVTVDGRRLVLVDA